MNDAVGGVYDSVNTVTVLHGRENELLSHSSQRRLKGTRRRVEDASLLAAWCCECCWSLVVLALAWRWIGSRWNARSSATKPVTDLAATMPMNQAGGGVAPADAYEVYSGLYQTPMDEPLAFAESSVTDIPQVDGSCLKPTTADEREMADAFAAANRQSHQWEQKFSIPQGYKLLATRRTDASASRAWRRMGAMRRNARLTSRSSMCGIWECRVLTRRTRMRWCR